MKHIKSVKILIYKFSIVDKKRNAKRNLFFIL